MEPPPSALLLWRWQGNSCYPGCRPYAAAIVEDGEAINLCPPGGNDTVQRLADYKRPRRLDRVDELPRNATGTVMKHRLAVPEDA